MLKLFPCKVCTLRWCLQSSIFGETNVTVSMKFHDRGFEAKKVRLSRKSFPKVNTNSEELMFC